MPLLLPHSADTKTMLIIVVAAAGAAAEATNCPPSARTEQVSKKQDFLC